VMQATEFPRPASNMSRQRRSVANRRRALCLSHCRVNRIGCGQKSRRQPPVDAWTTETLIESFTRRNGRSVKISQRAVTGKAVQPPGGLAHLDAAADIDTPVPVKNHLGLGAKR
jgi:hypothetical protein